MRAIILIFRHEFRKTVRRTGFIILTLALPVLALLGIVIYQAVSGITREPAEINEIGYVDQIGTFDQFTDQGNIKLVSYSSAETAKEALLNKEIKQYFIIPPDFVSTGTITLFSTQRQLAPPQATSAALQRFITSNLLKGDVPDNVIVRVEAPLNVVALRLDSTGAIAPEQGGYANFVVPAVFGFLLAFSLMFSAAYVLQSLGEEKETRLIEIMLSSVSTRQILAGKVLGLGAAGLLQVIFWVISLRLILSLASSSIGGFISTIQVPASFWVLGIVYFILGYSLYAVISASVAAISSSVHEAQGLSAIYSLFNVAPFWFSSALILFPNSPVWVVLGIFPLTAPVLTVLRLGVTGVPSWQLAASMIVLVLTIAGGLWLAARLLRAYMLMYGKRPGLGEILKNLRSS